MSEPTMDAADFDRIEQEHAPTITYVGVAVCWVCSCGERWPCPAMTRADDARQQHHRLSVPAPLRPGSSSHALAVAAQAQETI